MSRLRRAVPGPFPAVAGNPRVATASADVAAPTPLVSHAITLPATFAFSCYGVPFEAAVVRDDEAVARLVVRGDLGVLPFSAESATARRYMRAVIDAGADLPHATITLSKRQSVSVRGSMEFPRHPSSAAVAAGSAAIVLAAKPLIDLIAACRALVQKP